MSKILANQIANYGDDAPIELKEGLNIPAGRQLQADGIFGTTGQILSSDGVTIQWVTPSYFSGNYNDLTNQPTIPPAQVNVDWTSSSGVTAILNKPAVPPLPSVTIANASGGGTLAYNNVNGEFTFTPPDLSPYLTSYTETDPLFNASAAASITFTNITNWNLAYGWGDHAQAGYATTTQLNDLASNQELWDLAYSWGDHSIAGYLTSYTETDPVFGASPAADITDINIANWNLAYSWGDHAQAGYLQSYTEVSTLDAVLTRGNSTTKQIVTNNKVFFANNFADLAALNVVNENQYNGMFATVVSTGRAYYSYGGTPTGGWTQLIDTGSSIGELSDVDITTTAPTNGQVLKWDGSNFVPLDESGGADLTAFSVTTNAAGSAALSYDNTSGVFTYTPPDLSSFSTFSGAYADLTGKPSIPVNIQDLSNVNITGIADGQVLKWNTASSEFLPANDLQGNQATGILLTDLSASNVAASGGGSLAYNNQSGVFTFTPPDLSGYVAVGAETDPVFLASPVGGVTSTQVSNWDTAYGWGDHAQAGYLTGFTETDPIFTAHPANTITNAKIVNWDTAYSWGDHSTEGYLTASINQQVTFADNQELRFGAGVDLRILSDGNSGHIKAPADINIKTSAGQIIFAKEGTPDKVMAKMISDGAVQLFHNGTQKFETTSTGATVSGIVAATGGNSTDWNTAFSWGDHSQEGYLTSYTVVASDLNSISINALSDVDTVSTTPQDGYVLTWQASNSQWVPAESSGGANVTISDTPPTVDVEVGDLWWESDTGRLKVYYQDIDTTQWVDASPPLGTEASSLVEAGANGEISFGDAPSDLSSNTASNSIKLYCDKTANSNAIISYNASLRPTQNNAFDIGNAELKIRDLYQSNPSDIRLKKDIADYSGGLDFINSLRVVDFTWKQEVEQKAGKRETGFIAQEIGNALALSNYNSWRLHSANPDSYQGVDHTQLIPALVSAIQELTARVAELENK